MVVRSFVRAIISLVGAVLPLIFLSGFYSPLGSYLPKLPELVRHGKLARKSTRNTG